MAILSDCDLYRYQPTRGDLSDPLVFIMLDPSRADAVIIVWPGYTRLRRHLEKKRLMAKAVSSVLINAAPT